jgi:hypothetical protein
MVPYYFDLILICAYCGIIKRAWQHSIKRISCGEINAIFMLFIACIYVTKLQIHTYMLQTNSINDSISNFIVSLNNLK